VSKLVPAGSIYPHARGKSVEIFISGGAVGGLVSSRAEVFELKYLWPDGRAIRVIYSTLSTCTDIRSVVLSAGNSTYNYDNPVVRDVVGIGEKGDNVTTRFTADNAGPWFLNCDTVRHSEK
jgi:hypothetical protein